MNLFNMFVGTWSRFFGSIIELLERFVDAPVASVFELISFFGEGLLLLICVSSFFSFLSALYGCVVSLCLKLTAHPSQYTEYSVGDTRRSALFAVISALILFLSIKFMDYLSGYDAAPKEVATLADVANSMGEATGVVSDAAIIIFSILPFLVAYRFVTTAYAKHDAKNLQSQ
ncbi:hypothetical protein OTK49_00820 [Vibrio coralliirubri]|uniref:hypothetical protein n=1 Tax=Vibrio coralliirubri TaxID=1516159 RepID=UPI00228452BF|nr:hypothetical protein [Vibrio coralliirubri]MCY9861073.1 hypothetical protein [Vibrio coralliirubri]